MKLSELAIKQYDAYQKAAQETLRQEAERAVAEVRDAIEELAYQEDVNVDGLDWAELQPNLDNPRLVRFGDGTLWLCGEGDLRYQPKGASSYFVVRSLADLGRCLK